MDDLETYIEERKRKEPEFTVVFEVSYMLFRFVACDDFCDVYATRKK